MGAVQFTVGMLHDNSMFPWENREGTGTRFKAILGNKAASFFQQVWFCFVF